ncbi:unnamed protein product [Coregonus sp. 'balchen']|nr:unnamed protein product [Coregonus sp. 'balchen']
MAGGDSGPEGEEPSSPPTTGEGGGKGDVFPGKQGDGEGVREERLGGEESGGEPSGGEVGQEDEEMASGTHDLSASVNHSPRSNILSLILARSPVVSTAPSLDRQANTWRTDAGRGQAHREMMVTVAEMKKTVPSDKCSRSKASTVEALHYALNCVKQVQSNSEYYKLLLRNSQEERPDSTGGKDREGEMRYNPFKITPYPLKVQGGGALGEEEESCCLALAERIISGYEGYLPQDLIGTSLLTCIHPKDRPIMLSMHRKVLKYAGQSPFEHSPVRLRCQNGDYAKIYKLFLQPVHNNGSSGYGSLGSNGSHEHYISVASSSDSNGNLWEDSHHESVRGHEETRKQAHIPSYQQINSVDSIIRYLEGCGPVLKLVVLDNQVSVGSTAAVVVGAPLTDITLSTKAMSVVSVTSQCSYSSTIVHVPQPESVVTALEDAPMGSEPADPTPARAAPRPTLSSSAKELQLVGLTKEVLSAHTQKEEQEYVDRFRHRILHSPYSSYLQQDNSSGVHSHHPGDYVIQPVSAAGLNRTRTGKPNKHKRPKPQTLSDSYASPPEPPRRAPLALLAPYSSWPSSESSNPLPQLGLPYPPISPPQAPMGHLQTPYFIMLGGQPGVDQGGKQQQACVGPMVLQPDQNPNSIPQNFQHNLQQNIQQNLPQNFQFMQPIQNMQTQSMQSVQMQSIQSNFPSQNFQSIQIQNIQGFPNMQPMAPSQGLNPYMAPMMAVILANYPFYPSGYSTNYPSYPPGYPTTSSLLPQAPFTMSGFGPGLGPLAQPQPSSQPQTPPGQLHCSPRPSSSVGEEAATGPPALFSSSRSSSPLQLNLLQEELPKPSEDQSSTGHTHAHAESLHEAQTKGIDAPCESGNHDAQSTSSELLDLLLQEDARSACKNQETQQDHAQHTQHAFNMRAENSLWRMIQHMPEPVMMTYQIHPRDQAEVLAEDKEKLHLLRPLQPWFTQEQREELAEVHPWIQQHTVPQMLDTQGCVNCSAGTEIHPQDPESSSPLEGPQHDSSPAPDT